MLLSVTRLSNPFLACAALLAAAIPLAGCDRQSPGAAQPGAGNSTETPISPAETGGGATGAAAGESRTFNGTLDIASRGAAMPEFTVKDPTGKTLSSASLKGRPVLINLWATWCGPCVLEMPMLDKLAGDTTKGLRVITISEDMNAAEKVASFFATRKFAHLEPWLDQDNDLSFHYNTGTLPTTVLYDAEGREVWRMIGAHDWSGARTDAMLGDVLPGAK